MQPLSYNWFKFSLVQCIGRWGLTELFLVGGGGGWVWSLLLPTLVLKGRVQHFSLLQNNFENVSDALTCRVFYQLGVYTVL